MADHDIVISGGGVAGLTAAAAFGTEGFSVLCVDPATPVTEEAAEGSDLRTTAFLQPSVQLLDAAGLWCRLAPHAMPLQVMRIVDAGGHDPLPRQVRDFDAAEISDEPFGWNVPNWLLRREMLARLAELANVTFEAGIGTTSVVTRDATAHVTLSDGRRVSTRLLVGADGRDSAVRRALGIGVRAVRYGQKALVFAVTHPIPHDNVSTEIHRSGGPFTLVPLPDRDGRPASAVVWMERGPEALRLFGLPVPEFEAAMSERACHLFGPLTLATRRTLWPIITQVAERTVARRTVLIAEAAHVIPPIGAQGLNMSLADLASLLDLARADPDRLGDAAMLAAHARRRTADVALRMAGVDLLNRASMLTPQPLRDLRAGALGALHALAPVRRAMMRAGLGVR
ncbi:MAG: UbiH/UbiF family hydroxylase [Gemmobacter sp.]